MKTIDSLHSFEHVVIDSEIVPLLVKERLNPSLEQFFPQAKFHTVGSSGPINTLVKTSGGLELEKNSLPNTSSTWDSIHFVGFTFFQNLSELLQVPLEKMRTRVLHLKSAKDQQVLLDRFQGQVQDSRERYKSKGCHLRLVACGVETCSFGCIYCFANYNYAQPTTLLLDSPVRIKTDLQCPQLRELVSQGIPIYLGSLADMFSPESILFRIPQRMLKSLAGCRVFTVTKSPLIALPEMLEAIKTHKLTKVVFTYSSLIGFEKNLPYDAREFPSETLQKLVNHGIDTVLLYKPIIPGINDRKKQILHILRKAVDSGIEEVSMGFLQMDPEMEISMSQMHKRQYRYFDRVLTDKVGDERVPPLRYRLDVMRTFADICSHLNLRLSFCQAYGGAVETELESSHCVCCLKRWSN